jgi:hypothetical protein
LILFEHQGIVFCLDQRKEFESVVVNEHKKKMTKQYITHPLAHDVSLFRFADSGTEKEFQCRFGLKFFVQLKECRNLFAFLFGFCQGKKRQCILTRDLDHDFLLPSS